MNLTIVTECMPANIIANYTTPFVQFLDIESDLNWKPPPECQKTKGGAAVVKRFLIFHHMFQQGYFDDYKYVVHIDLRDSRAFHWPHWGNCDSTTKLLWLQSVVRNKG
jgi:hypothetical protein